MALASPFRTTAAGVFAVGRCTERIPRPIGVVVIALWLGCGELAGLAPAQDDLMPTIKSSDDWLLMRQLQARWMFLRPEHRDGLLRVTIPPALYGVASANLADIRIIDMTEGDFVEIPYVVCKPRDETMVTPRKAEMLNHSETNVGTELVLDASAVNDRIDEIFVNIHDDHRNYERAVQVFGADAPDAEEWYPIVLDGVVLDIARPGYWHTRSRIPLPMNGFQYYKVVIDNRGQEPLRIVGADFLKREDRIAPRREFPGRLRSQVTDPARKVSEVIVDLGHERLPSVGATVTVEFDGDFKRVVSFSAADSNDETTSWQPLTKTSWFRIERPGLAARSLRADWSDARGRFLKITIHNGDEPPLKVTDCSGLGIDWYLVVHGRTISEDTALFAGNKNLAAPKYDWAQAVGEVEVEMLSEARLAPATMNPAYEEPPPQREIPWYEKIQWPDSAATAVRLVALVALVLLLFRVSRKSRRS